MQKKRPPRHLRPATRRWFAAVIDSFELEEHHERLLVLACEAFDRGQEAREIVGIEGLSVLDRFGQARAHPLIAVERDCRVAFARLIRELDLDVAGPVQDVSRRPPHLRSVG